jgi:DNA mismatch repair ATPase MutL
VRKDLAIKGAAKCLANTRRLLQAYALARPAVRFRLHILKAKNNKGDFVYAPKANANVQDAALKIVGKECALQYDWTALELDGFEVYAFIPKPTAIGSKIANHGAFTAVDSRPVSSKRGTLKKIAVAVRDRLRKANSTLANVKDPFFCLNIICPVDSYDPNIEPAKDDVIFGDENLILTIVDRLLVSYLTEKVNVTDSVEDIEDVAVTKLDQMPEVPESPSRPPTSFSIHEDIPVMGTKLPDSAAQNQPPRWRSSIYGIEEEDLEFLQENMHDMPEEEEGGRLDAAISNPWTIARINAPTKPKKPVGNRQLLSPAKSSGDVSIAPHTPAPVITPRHMLVEPLTPQTPSQANGVSNELNDELPQSIRLLPAPTPVHSAAVTLRPGARNQRTLCLPWFEERMSPSVVQPAPQAYTRASLVDRPEPPRRKPRAPNPFKNKPYAPPAPVSEDTWFGQPMRSASKANRLQKRQRQQAKSFFPNDDTFSSQRSLVISAAERLNETRLISENNTDIRDFFGSSRRAPADVASSQQSHTSRLQHVGDQLLEYAEHGNTYMSSPRRPRSADYYHRSTDTAQEMDALFQLYQNASPAPSSSPIRTVRSSRNASLPAPRSTSRPRRRRTTDSGLHRTKSSTLPLNFIPNGFDIHNMTLDLTTSVSSIAQQARTLAMGADTLEWGYDSTETFDTFKTPVAERKIMQWVIKIDDLLAEIFERRDVEIRGALHEGIQRFLDIRKQDEEVASERAVVHLDKNPGSSGRDGSEGQNALGPDSNLPTRGLRRDEADTSVRMEKMGSAAIAGPKGDVTDGIAVIDVDDLEESFDFEQFVDLSDDTAEQDSLKQVVKTEHDDMLMDL